MYVLTDKYGCEDLRSHVLNALRESAPAALDFLVAFSGVFHNLTDHDALLREAIVRKLAPCYAGFRCVKSASNWL